ncbi:hypothetical protein [Bhargavaea beijingensis]|uniref:hypothetical protein n=1 Tax=Bhargavaea beijingensis TaxID=426756 RepID=UPI0022259A47|nr:hypothetical protein [Bhargavaea beijingensis]MCW1929561.1 hypothetical protein [Bhargavaea beijingensis]
MTKRKVRKQSTQEQRQNKRFVEKLLLVKGIDYNDWLDEIHQEYIKENAEDILDHALNVIDRVDKIEEEQADETLEHSNY